MQKDIFIFTLSVLIFLNSPTIQAQACPCSELLKQLIQKVENNYAGYVHKVREAKDSSSYLQLKKNLIVEALSTSHIDCYNVLTKFINYFKDGHLFVIELPQNTPQQSDSLKQLIKRITLTEKQAVKLKAKKNADLLEGIWVDKNQKIVIIKNSTTTFTGVTIENSNTGWTRGMVKMEIEKRSKNEYFITIYRNDFAPIRFSNVHIYKKCLLPFGVYRFAKESPVDPELKYVNTADPQMPVFQRLDDKNIVLTIPTALINKSILDSILQVHEKEIISTENFIIDVRGNLGGNGIWRNLIALANTKSYIPSKKEGGEDFLLLASPDNADYIYKIGSYFRETGDSIGIMYYDKLTRKIKQHPGSILGFSFYDPTVDTSRKRIYEFPKRVAIITDRGTASAGEAFVMSMRSNSSKVIVYGDNTYGMIDYMNINTKKIPCEENNSYYYGYPTFFAPSIKTEPINPTGLKPDVYVPQGTTDWIQWVKNDLLKKQVK